MCQVWNQQPTHPVDLHGLGWVWSSLSFQEDLQGYPAEYESFPGDFCLATHFKTHPHMGIVDKAKPQETQRTHTHRSDLLPKGLIYIYIYTRTCFFLVCLYILYGTPPPPKPTVTHFLLIFTVFCAYFGALDFELCFGVSSP